MSRPLRLAVLVSGNGSNLQAILDAIRDGEVQAHVVAVVANRADAYGLDRARAAGVPAIPLEPEPSEPRADYDARLADVVAGYEPDHVVLAGWMRILTMAFLGRFPNRVLNLHPALPGELPGTRAIERAWREAEVGERTQSGVMVHLVPDEGVDDGPVLAAEALPIDIALGREHFEASVHAVEHRLLVDVLRRLTSASTSETSPQPPTGKIHA